VQSQHIRCYVCGAHAARLEIEIVGTAGTPSEIIDLDAWIKCPRCGPRKQSAGPDVGQKATVDYIPSLTDYS
jgi:DNA-directed RNA polymerase subunit RPC12/RpoP